MEWACISCVQIVSNEVWMVLNVRIQWSLIVFPNNFHIVLKQFARLYSYPAPMYPEVTTDSPGPRKRQVRLKRLSLPV